MRSFRLNRLASSLATIGLLCAGTLATAGADAAEVVTEQKVRILNGQKYTFTKQVDEKGALRAVILDPNGRIIRETDLPAVQAVLIEPELQAAIEKLESAGLGTRPLRVQVALELPTRLADAVQETGDGELYAGKLQQATLNGKTVSEKELAELVARQGIALRAANAERAKERGEELRRWAERHGVIAQKGVEEAVAQGRTGVTLELTPALIRRMAAAKDPVVAGLGLYVEGEDDINNAMAATSISTAALPNATTRGAGIGIYMTESGCAAESRITNYDRLSGSETDHSRNVGAIIRAVSPASFLYCRGGAVLPQASDLNGVGGNAPIHIITRSHSSNDTTSYNTLDRDWDNFSYNNSVAIFNSGGNTGTGTGNVRSPGKGLNIVTVGNYNDSTNAIWGSSPFVDPQTNNDKPEIAAPGTSVTAGGFTMTGTSQATPHAAAFAADMMSSSTYLQYRPQLLKAKILAGATDAITGGFDKVGLGGIDFASAQFNGYWQWYSGNNASFGTFDSQDGSANGYIEKKIFISNSWNKARVVLSWMNRGTFSYAHRADAHPIGMDLDLSVYDPNGNYVGGSYSWDNPFERVNFTPAVSGYYTFKIKRFANRDTSSATRIGLYVNYYN
jgi:hypothetical protein